MDYSLLLAKLFGIYLVIIGLAYVIRRDFLISVVNDFYDSPGLIAVASALNLESELSRIFREEGLNCGRSLPPNCLLFANTHPAEIEEPELLKFSLRELRERAPTRPLVLEIHEAIAAQAHSMRDLRATLDDLNIGLAYDDFGAGQARLHELVEVPPDYLKFDKVIACGGSWMVKGELIAGKQFDRIAALTREAVDIARGA